MSLLAEISASPSPSALKDFLEVAFYIAGGVAAIVALWRMLSGAPDKTDIANQPIAITAHPEFVTRTDHTKDVTEIRDELKRHAARRAEIYDALKEQGAAIAKLQGETEQQSALLAEVRTDTKQVSADVSHLAGAQEGLTQQIQNLTLAVQQIKR